MKYEGSIETCILMGHGNPQSLENFLSIVKKATVAQIKNFTARSTGGKDLARAARDVQTLINRLSNEPRGALKESHHPNRSDACWTIIIEMINRGFTDEEILLVLRNYPNGPARHYAEHNTSMAEDIKRIRQKYKRNSYEWPEGTQRTKDRIPYQNVHNVVLALQSPEFDGLFTYDEMERVAKVTEPLPDIFNNGEARKGFPVCL